MAELLKITVDNGSVKRVEGRLKQVSRFPDLTRKAMMQWGKVLEREMISSLHTANVKPWGGGKLSLFKDIQWRQRPKGDIGRLFMPLHGVYLDSMNPHHVALKPGRLITKWARQRMKGRIPKVIYVRKRPFIKRGYNSAKTKLGPIIKQHLRRTE